METYFLTMQFLENLTHFSKRLEHEALVNPYTYIKEIKILLKSLFTRDLLSLNLQNIVYKRFCVTYMHVDLYIKRVTGQSRRSLARLAVSAINGLQVPGRRAVNSYTNNQDFNQPTITSDTLTTVKVNGFRLGHM